jgi:amino acid adenylation domain-containing protein
MLKGFERPLSGLQRGMLLEQLRSPAEYVFNHTTALRIPRSLDLDALRDAWRAVTARHDALRATFHASGDGYTSRVQPEIELDVRAVTATGASDGELRDLVHAEIRRPFALDRCLGRLRVFRVGDADDVLALTLHHLVADGLSLTNVLPDLAHAYGRLERREDAGLPPPPSTSYDDFIAEERAILSGDRLRELEDFWRKELADAPYLDIPTDHPRAVPPVADRAGVVRVTFSEPATRALHAISTGSSPFRTIVAAYAAFLQRYTDKRDLVIRCPATLQSERYRDAVGQFVNDLVLRVPASPRQSFQDLLAEVRSALTRAGRHRSLPFADIVRVVHPLRDPTRSILGEVTCLQSPPLHAKIQRGALVELGALTGTGFWVQHQDGDADLDLRTAEDAGRLECELHYRRDLFEHATAERMMRHFHTMVEGIASDPSRPLGQLPLLSSEERRAIVALGERASDPSRPLPELLLHDLFESAAKKTPSAVAIIEGERQLTYAEVNRRANALARRLLAAGVEVETPVALFAHRSIETLVGILAVMKAGGAYVPIDPTLPRARQTLIASRCGIRLALTTGEPPGLVANEMRLDGPDSESGVDENPRVRTSPDQAAVVLHTSGSTGVPKGVIVAHRGLVNYVLDRVRAFEVGPDDRALQMSALSFDVSIEEMFRTWASSGALVLVRAEPLLSPAELLVVCKKHRITIVDSPSAYFAHLVDEAAAQGGWPPAVRLIAIGGDRVPAGTVAKYYATNAALPRFVNIYGATETSVANTFAELATLFPRYGKLAETLIGEPVEHGSVHVLDEDLEVVPPGVIGEICIGGRVGLARGYLAAPALTAERFVPSPFTNGERLYRTGDLGRRLADGEIEIVGRRDHQVKVRGYRIELAEIDAALQRHPSVERAVVLVLREQTGGNRLVAYVQRKDSAPADLRKHLSAELPAYMVPATYIEVETWPYTAHQKLDKNALAALATAADESRFVAPRGPFEAAVAEVWSDVLGAPRVSVDADFFALGGHSLKALELKRRLEAWLKIDVPIATLLEAPTVEAQSKLLQSALDVPTKKTITELPRIQPKPEERFTAFPLTDMQQAYYLGRSELFDLGGIPAHGCLEFERESVDVERLEEAFNEVVRRHDMLRAVFLSESEQIVLPEVERYRIRAQDLRGKSRSEIEEALAQTREEMSFGLSYDATAGRRFDIRVARLSETTYRIFFLAELLVCDATSAQNILEEWARFYEDPGLELPPIGLAFRDYVLAQRALEDHPVVVASREYWWSRIPSLPLAPELPLAPATGRRTNSRFVNRVFCLDKARWQRMQQRGERLGLTTSAVIATAFADVLARWSKNKAFTLNCLFYNRMPLHDDVEKVVGNFSATSLLAIDVTPPSFVERAKAVQTGLWNDLSHAHVSGVRVLRELNRVRGGGEAAAMPVVFASTLPLDKQRGDEAAPFGRVVHRLMRTPQVLFDFQASEEGGLLHLAWDVVEKAFPPGLVQAMWEAFCAHVTALAENDALWTEAGRALVTAPLPAARAAANATDAPVSTELLHSFFVRQAAKTPEAVAVIGPDKRLTYAELLARASALAHELRGHGARPNQLVAIVMEKGWEQIVAAIGVLLAGAAYLPIDATQPEHRLQALFEAGEVKLAVTQPWVDSRLAWPGEIRRVVLTPADPPAGAKPPAPVQSHGDLAYVIFTSGSTGVPKGVMIDHRGAVNTVLDINRRFEVGGQDRTLAISSMSFDLSVYDVFGLLAVGGALVVPTQDMIREPGTLARLVSTESVTIWNSVPALLGMVVDHCIERGVTLPPTLRVALLSGDWIPVTLPTRTWSIAPKCRVVSLGGATEASIWSISYPIDQVDPAWTSVPYGRPLDNQRMYVLNDAFEDAPTWVPGDLYIGGIGLSLGYWKDEEKTNAAFRVNPRTGERLYKTGDLARYTPDGNLEFLGREDQQVKIQGFRIELGDVEAALSAHSSVQTAVCAAQGPRTNRRLVAFVVPRPGQTLAADGLVQFASARLPSYMVPSKVVLLDALPLSSNGKVDRGALERLEATSSAAGAAGYVEPRTRAERRVAAIWREILGAPRVGAQDEFFELGGTSLHAVRIASRIEKTFGKRLALNELLRGATVERVARAVEGTVRSNERASTLVPLRAEGSRPPLFFVHPIGGNVFCYWELSRRLGADQPFYALQSRGLEGDDSPHLTIEAMASEYLEEIRRIVPRGKYRIGGWSMGGLVAYELAQRLVADGDEVELLVMIDTLFPVDTTIGAGEASSSEDVAILLARDLEGMSGKGLGIVPADLRDLAEDAQHRFILDRAREVGALPDDLPPEDVERIFRVFAANAAAIRAYRPASYPGGVTHLLAKDTVVDAAAWRAVIRGPLDEATIPGDHYTLVAPPNVSALARELGKRCAGS